MTQEMIRFSDLNLSEPLLKALSDMNFDSASPIQAQTIPYLMEGRDVIGQAQTGTGKTAAFALPVLEKLSSKVQSTQALVIAPTRELAIQVASQFEALSYHLKGVTISVLCGGQDYSRQLKQLREGAHIVVGTPGRILDHIDRGTLKLNHLKTFVIDEADEMLRMGFIEDVEMILSKLPLKRQVALFSATMPSRIRDIANNYLVDPVSVQIRSETATVKAIEQKYLIASQGQKPDALIRVLCVEDYQGVIVFVRTKTSAEEVAEIVQQQGLRAMAIHGDITQTLRERIIAQFRQGAIDILIATDVAARGLDVDRVTHVINYDAPHDCETYVHRIGRTGRAGRSGVAILFAAPRESRLISNIERHTRQIIEKVTVPNDHMINEARQKRFMNDIHSRLTHDHLISYRKMIEDFLKEYPEASAVDAAAALALMMNKDKPWKLVLPKPKQSAKTSFSDERRGEYKGGKQDRKPFREKTSPKHFKDDGMQDLFRLDVGRVHGVKPGNIVGAIANEAGLQSRQITGLKIHDDHSTVRLPRGLPKEIFQGLNKAWVCGRQLKVTAISG